MPIIRLIESADNPAAAKIIREVMTAFGAVGEGYSIEDPEVDALFETYTQPGSAFFVVEQDHQILGTGGIGPLKGASEDTCELRKMYFLPALRGKGMGSELLERCIQKARVLGYKKMYLETLKSMTAANQLYKKFGFQALDKNIGATGHFACDSFYFLNL